MEPHSGNLFTNSSCYYINVKLNEGTFNKLNIEMPKYFSSDTISEIVFFRNFVGRCSSLLLTFRSHMLKEMALERYPFGFTSEALVDEFVTSRKDSLMLFYSPCSLFEGYLLNEAREEFHGVFSGGISRVSVRELKWYNHLDELMPYFYLIRFIETDKALIFNKLFKLIIDLMNEEISYQRYLFRLAYFAILDGFACFDEETLRMLSTLLERQEIGDVMRLVCDNMSLEILVSRKLEMPEGLKVSLGIPKKEFFVEMDKLWKTQWNKSQSFEGFWSSEEFVIQKDQPCNPKEYIFDPKKKKFYDWGISNFVTKEFCRPLLEPIFIEPSYVSKLRVHIELDNKDVPELEKYFSPLVKPEEIGIKTHVSKRESLMQLIGMGKPGS